MFLSGAVLVSGGSDPNGQLVGPAELYHPASGTWTLTAGRPSPIMTSAELFHAAQGTSTLTTQMVTDFQDRISAPVGVALPDGRALILGVRGFQLSCVQIFGSVVYDAATALWATLRSR